MGMTIKLEWTCSECGSYNHYNASACFELHRKGEFNITTLRFGDKELVCKNCGKAVKVTRGKPGFLNIGGVAP